MKYTKAQQAQLDRPPKVLKTAHIPGPRRRPKTAVPVELPEALKSTIAEDLSYCPSHTMTHTTSPTVEGAGEPPVDNSGNPPSADELSEGSAGPEARAETEAKPKKKKARKSKVSKKKFTRKLQSPLKYGEVDE